MKYFYTIVTISMLTCAAGIASMCADIHRNRQQYEAYVGSSYGSATITGYNTFTRVFILSDGSRVSKYLITNPKNQ